MIRGDLADIHPLKNSIKLGAVECIVAQSVDSTTAGSGDNVMPSPGQVFFYLAEYFDGLGLSSYGSTSAPAPRAPSPGGCE